VLAITRMLLATNSENQNSAPVVDRCMRPTKNETLLLTLTGAGDVLGTRINKVVVSAN